MYEIVKTITFFFKCKTGGDSPELKPIRASSVGVLLARRRRHIVSLWTAEYPAVGVGIS